MEMHAHQRRQSSGSDGFILMGAGINKVALGLAAEVQIKIEVGLHR
jgi:hypothetical protein